MPFSQSQAQSSVRVNAVAFPDTSTLCEMAGRTRLHDDEFHIKPNDICLTRVGKRTARQSTAITPIIHCDPFQICRSEGQMQWQEDSLRFVSKHAVVCDDYGSYLCDMYDARSHGEEVLNRMQASCVIEDSHSLGKIRV